MLCPCRCHAYSSWAITPAAVPSIDAVTACDACVNAHCAVLLEKRVWYDATVAVPPAVGGCDGEWSGEDGG